VPAKIERLWQSGEIRSMLKTLALTIAIGAGSALLATDAGALPLAQDKAGVAASDTVLLVRERCGPGRQWSERRRRCVTDTPRGMMRDMTRRHHCGRGLHWSDRRGRCVRN
jgi:hypothetical protein